VLFPGEETNPQMFDYETVMNKILKKQMEDLKDNEHEKEMKKKLNEMKEDMDENKRNAEKDLKRKQKEMEDARK